MFLLISMADQGNKSSRGDSQWVVSNEIEAIIQLKKKNLNSPFRETAETLGVAKSTKWYILKMKECSGELSTIERPRRLVLGN